MYKLIRNWNDLVGLESEQYKLDIDTEMGCGHIVPKDEFSSLHSHYLSTHTFYGSSYKDYEKLLWRCGFNIKLQPWE